ncbi:hypothetical protein BDW02DRAFT_5450 [Decorospora gaudefroyi]|uniref:Uncharacterized protein n=1 Tax=Decorospora gaudefroyi TaxID=184978 RepID=A0A6A5KW77_9PLEO|nr:hypothetical protein BDW02DRAFT_5450 [Decorospora gaudefroyi]
MGPLPQELINRIVWFAERYPGAEKWYPAMPVLEYFMLTSELTGEPGRLHISYHAPGNEAEWGDKGPEDIHCRRIYYACEIGKGWVPEPETAEGLRGTGMEKFGGEVIERYLGSLYY